MIEFTLEDFVRESNRIEGIIREPTQLEMEAHHQFLDVQTVRVYDLQTFVMKIQLGATLRDRAGLNVQVGQYRPPPGGIEIVNILQTDLHNINEGLVSPWLAHKRYENLHPFTDGNGRSGRVLWLWMMGGIDYAPLGFLHTLYYQTLQET